MTEHSEIAGAVESIRATASMMLGDPRFKCVFEEWPRVVDADIRAWEEWADTEPGMSGYRLPPALRAVYLATGGFRWRWQYLPDTSSTGTVGSAQLVSLLALYQRDEEANQPLSMIYRAPRPFDVIGEQEYVAIRFSAGAPTSLPLIHVDKEESLEAPLTLDVARYLPTVARYRAAYGWQSLFHEKPKDRDATARRLDDTVKRLFT